MTDTAELLRNAYQNATTDGCTMAPELWIHQCCNEHDRAYATHTDAAGQPITRLQADNQLFTCARKKNPIKISGGWLIPGIYWLAVRIFGRARW